MLAKVLKDALINTAFIKVIAGEQACLQDEVVIYVRHATDNFEEGCFSYPPQNMQRKGKHTLNIEEYVRIYIGLDSR